MIALNPVISELLNRITKLTSLGKIRNIQKKRQRVSILQKVRKLLEKGWCQNVLALDERNFPIRPSSSRATSWYLMGAFVSIIYDPKDYNSVFTTEHITVSLPIYNDDIAKTKADVLQVIDNTILYVQKGKITFPCIKI